MLHPKKIDVEPAAGDCIDKTLLNMIEYSNKHEGCLIRANFNGIQLLVMSSVSDDIQFYNKIYELQTINRRNYFQDIKLV